MAGLTLVSSLFFWSLVVASPVEDICQATLQAFIASTPEAERLTSKQKDFIATILLPAVGTQVLQASPEKFRSCTLRKDCLKISGFEPPSKPLVFQWSREIVEPT